MESLKIKIDCTREQLESAKYCGMNSLGINTAIQHIHKQQSKINLNIVTNCWIAVAVREILPGALVYNEEIKSGNVKGCIYGWYIPLPPSAQEQIIRFDHCTTLEERSKLEPFSFEIEIDSETLDKILEENCFDLKELESIIKRSGHLEII